MMRARERTELADSQLVVGFLAGTTRVGGTGDLGLVGQLVSLASRLLPAR